MMIGRLMGRKMGIKIQEKKQCEMRAERKCRGVKVGRDGDRNIEG